MLSQLKQVSRRITAAIRGKNSGATGKNSDENKGKDKKTGKAVIGGLMATKSTKGSKTKAPAPKAKPAAKAAVKVAKPAAKAAPKAKPAAKVAVKVAKPAAKAAPKAKPAAKPAVKVGIKAPSEKVPAKVAAKVVPAEKPSKAPAPGKAAPIKVGKKAGNTAKAEATDDKLSADDFAGAEEFASDMASDMEAAEAEVGAVEAVEAAEPLTPSAALLQAMKPTISEEKAAEKKKKKDDLKLDRGGDLEAQWQTLKDKNKAIKPANYKMSESFEARTPILHKLLGWGFIITNQNDRLEVLFQQGIKFLISNYKA